MGNKNKVWVLTREHNEYDQHGEYFVCVFSAKPTLEKIAPIVGEEVGLPGDMGKAIAHCQHVLNGGGRLGTEDVWLNLELVEVK